MVTSKGAGGTFAGRFTALAQPDFQGTMAGGQSVVFEAKYTTTDRMKREVLTKEQMDAVETALRPKLPEDVELTVMEGGQPVYHLIVSVE